MSFIANICFATSFQGIMNRDLRSLHAGGASSLAGCRKAACAVSTRLAPCEKVLPEDVLTFVVKVSDGHQNIDLKDLLQEQTRIPNFQDYH